MKIYSKFKDYYDGASVNGVDNTRSFIRTNSKIEIPELKFDKLKIGLHIFSKIQYKIIGFCGELYPFIDYGTTQEGFISTYNLVSYFEDPKLNLYKEDFINKHYTYKYNLRTNSNDFILRENEKPLTSDYQNLIKHKDLLSFFRKYKTPIFLYNPTEGKRFNAVLEINPILKNYGFYKVYDSVTAFMKIEQYLNNELASEIDIKTTVGNDEVIGKSKGFDRYSFRNAKKKPKKW